MEAKGFDSKHYSDGVDWQPGHPQFQAKGEPTARIKDARGNGAGRANGREAKLVSLVELPQAKEMLLSVLHACPAHVRLMVVTIREKYPGRTPGEILSAIRHLRDDRGDARGKHAIWSEEGVLRLKAAYTRGPTEVQQIREALLRENPSWNRHTLNWQVRKLGISVPHAPAIQWSAKAHGSLMFLSGEKNIRCLAAGNHHSMNAIYVRLSRNGVSGRVRVPTRYSQREAGRLLGVSHTTVGAWMGADLLPGLTERAIRKFCHEHPEKVNRKACTPVVRGWLPRVGDVTESNRNRAHLAHHLICPKCDRTIRGNGYYTHAKRCLCESQASGSNVNLSSAAVQLSRDG